MGGYAQVPASIGAGASLSAAVDVGPGRIVGIKTPAGWDAAGITFQALVTSVGNPAVETYGDVKDEAGAEVAIASMTGATFVTLTTKRLGGLGRIKVRSGTSGSPINQADAVTVILVLGD